MKSTAGTLQNIPIKSSESTQLKNISNSNESPSYIDFTRMNPNKIVANLSTKICSYDASKNLSICVKMNNNSKCKNM